MTSRPGVCLKLLENNTFMTLAGMVMVLMTVALVVVGMGMSPIHLWLIMATVAITWLSFCRCINWQRKANDRCRASDNRERCGAPIGTISNGIQDNNMDTNERGLRAAAARTMGMPPRDAPPTYDSVSVAVEQPPPYSAVVLKEDADVITETAEPPPPYDSSSDVSTVADPGDTRGEGEGVRRPDEQVCVITRKEEVVDMKEG